MIFRAAQPRARLWWSSKVSRFTAAAAVGRPRARRAVGQANHVNPRPIFIPCHRVVGKNGALTGYAGGLDLKGALLALESGKECL